MAPRASGFGSRQHGSLKILLNDAPLESHACDACLGNQGALAGGGHRPLKVGVRYRKLSFRCDHPPSDTRTPTTFHLINNGCFDDVFVKA